ncbi:MAG: hypothetical protein ACX94B_08020 [Henriciella sp.]
MIRRLTSAGILVALASASFADTGANDVSKPEPEAAEAPAGGLDAFVETAIQKGLLVPSGETAGEDAVSPVQGAVVAAPCPDSNPLDFAVVRNLRRFTELPNALSEVEAEDATTKLRRDVKSKLALGLYAEAKTLITRQSDPEWHAYRNLISLLENRDRPDIAYFEALADCHPGADLWLAVAELAVFSPQGTERIAGHIGSVRSLPFAMREDVATLIVPTLLIERRRDLGQQILATFTPQEIENSVRLSALRTAVVDMPDGSESDDRLVMLMSQPKLKLAALLILVERKNTLRPTVRSFVLEEAWNVLEANETQHDMAPILRFVIEHLASDDLYAGLERVRSLEIASRPDVEEAIDRFAVNALNDYLADRDPANSLNALQTLSVFNSELPLDATGAALRKRGAMKALELGLYSMVPEFLTPVERDQEVALMLAEAAFWSGDNRDLFEVRDAFPQSVEINRMAGIRALQANAPTIAASAFSALASDPSKQLELLEYGALANNWVLWSTDLAALVTGLSDDEVVRLDRIRTIQTSKRSGAVDVDRNIRPFQIAGLLDSTRRTLAQSPAGATE